MHDLFEEKYYSIVHCIHSFCSIYSAQRCIDFLLQCTLDPSPNFPDFCTWFTELHRKHEVEDSLFSGLLGMY